VRQKHLTDVSAGYRVLKYTDIEPGQEAVIGEHTYKNDFDRVLRVTTKWKLKEGSLVPIGADEASKIKRELENINSRSSKIMDETKTKDQGQDQNQGVLTRSENSGTAVEYVRSEPPPVDTAKIERETREKELRRIQEIMKIGENFGMITEAQTACREEVSVDAFRKQILETLKTQKTIDTKAAELDIPEKDKKKYSLSNVFRALILNDPNQAPFEYEISRELEKKFERKPQGIFIPHDVMVGDMIQHAARTLTAASGGASVVGTDHLAGSFIELLRARVVLQRMGVLTLTGLQGDVSIPRQTGAATGGWLSSETAAAVETDQSFDSVTLTPKNAYADTKFSRQLLLQANPSIEGLVLADLIAVMARVIDLGGINGSGASGQPTGLLNTSGVGTVDGTSIGWAGVVEFETDVGESNADDLASLYWLMRPSVRGLMKTRNKDAGSGIFVMENNMMNGYPSEITTQMPVNNLVFGAFSQMIMGFWGVLDLLINPFLYANNRYVAIHSTQTTDIGVRHAAAFSKSTNVT
jgi:HK97 family phage major capsid protein